MTAHLRRGTAAVAVLLAGVVALSGCSASGSASTPSASAVVDAPSSLVADGAFTYGTAATFPPFEYQEGGTDTGFDIEMGKELAGYMGLTPKATDLDFNGLIPALKGKRLDVINSAMYINDERSAQVDFIPYLKVGEALLVPKGNEHDIAKLPGDLSGRTVAVTAGAIGETYMKEFNAELEKQGKKPMTIMSLPTNQDALLAVSSGRADAFDTSTPGAAYTLTKQSGKFEIATDFKVGTKIGIAVRKGDTAMKQAVQDALDEFVRSGKYAKLMEKYNLPSSSAILD
jgi:polar amino acid transport system substrate-binding protein